jgi:GxxExxY protein
VPRTRRATPIPALIVNRDHFVSFVSFCSRLKFDLLADDCLLADLKAVYDVAPIHKTQLLSYMKLLNVPLGLLFNFHEIKIVDGISRLLLPGANQP